MKRLNPKEEQIMQILWQLENAFMKDIWEALETPRPPITTTASIVKKLETAGFVDHETFGRTHRYFPAIKKEDYRQSSFKNLVDNYFGGSPKQLLSYFVDKEEMGETELDELLQEIKDKKKE
ncbi:MAG: BlaI/MecI/CopY family transcriptional regulator [Saprospiraceae bacterium]